MKLSGIAFVMAFIPALCFGAGSTPKLTLAEKIALAKHMADEAAEGRAEVGRVVSGDFDFAHAVEEFRKSQAEKPETYGSGKSGSMTAVPEMEEIDDDGDEEVFPIMPTQSPGAPKIDAAPRGEPLPRGGSKAAGPENPAAETKAGGIAKEMKQSKEPPKYVVDTTGDDFINGFFVGKLGSENKKLSDEEIREREFVEKAAAESEKYFNYTSSLFYIVSDDYDALSSAIPFVRECENLFNYYFAAGDSTLSFVRRITLYLVSADAGKMKSRFSISNSGVDTRISARWDESLNVSDFCKLLASSTLRKIYMEERGQREDAGENPYWLELALSICLKQRMCFGVSSILAHTARENYTGDFMELISLPRSRNGAPSESMAFWTFKTLERASPNREEFRRFLYALPLAESPKQILDYVKSHFPRLAFGGNFDEAWNCMLMGEIWSRLNSGVSSPEFSAEEVMRLAVVQADTADGGRIGFSDRQIWEKRDAISREIELRLIEIKIALPRTNPIYHNTMLALGEVFECALDGDKADFDALYEKFIKEYRSAREIAELVRAQMSKADSSKTNKTLDSQ